MTSFGKAHNIVYDINNTINNSQHCSIASVFVDYTYYASISLSCSLDVRTPAAPSHGWHDAHHCFRQSLWREPKSWPWLWTKNEATQMMIQMAALFRRCQVYGTFEHKKYTTISHVWVGQFPETRTDNAIAFFVFTASPQNEAYTSSFPYSFVGPCMWSWLPAEESTTFNLRVQMVEVLALVPMSKRVWVNIQHMLQSSGGACRLCPIVCALWWQTRLCTSCRY
jgi:hypothetical protein